MKITLKINGEDKDFTLPFIPARMLKKTVQIGKSMEKDAENENNFDDMAQFIVDIYGKQFTVDDVLDGLSSVKLIEEFTNCIEAVTSGLNEKMDKLAETSPNV